VLADLVIGADGVRSRTALLVDAPVLERHPASGACFYAYVADVPWEGYEFHLGYGAFAGVFPTHGSQACVWLIRPRHLAGPLLSAGSGRLAVWRDALTTLVPELGARVASGSVSGPLRGAVGLPTYVRRCVGPGWALVGDAGYHRDPITGHGMTDAFRDAELLAVAADRALREPRRSRWSLLEDYQRRRDTALADCLRLTCALSAFPPPGRFTELQAELSRALDVEARDLAARPLPFEDRRGAGRGTDRASA
jgi:flavin-dependent dehydrogenase